MKAKTAKTSKLAMNTDEFGQLLRDLEACSEAVAWAKGKSLAEVWHECERGDWLLWLLARMEGKAGWPSRQEIVLAACACAETALKFVRKGEDRPRLAIAIARSWARGCATLQEVRAAADAAYAAYAAYAAAAYAAADAADDAAADAAAAYAAAAAAAYAAAYVRASKTWQQPRQAALKQCADLVRSAIKLEVA